MICDALPRRRLVHLPTPLEAAPMLSRALGIELLVKREDLAGLCVGGIKSRLLEFAIGALQGRGIDTLIAYAAVQSNKLRDIAAASARCGMKAVLLIPEGRGADDPVRQGNRLLFDILGAEVRVIAGNPDAAAIMAAQESVRDALAREGRRAAILDRRLEYGIDATIAFVDAAEELCVQLRDAGKSPHSLFVAAGAGMTAAGLALGLKHLGSPMRVVGVSVSARAAELGPEIERHAARAAARLGIPTRLHAGDVTLIDRHAATGYGTLTPALVAVMRRFARLHGMVVDPVYNAKVALALVEEVGRGTVPAGAGGVFMNTDDSPAIYDYADVLCAVPDAGDAQRYGAAAAGAR